MVFVSSNPTNLVISSASGINFIYFSGWTIIPAILSSCTLFPVLMLQFFPKRWARNFVPVKLKPPEVDPRVELKDLRGAIFKALLLAATLTTLIIASVFVHGLYVWWVTVPAALLAVLHDIIHDWKGQAKEEEDFFDKNMATGSPSHTLDGIEEHPYDQTTAQHFSRISTREGSSPTLRSRWSLPHLQRSFASHFPTVHGAAARMPWPLVPFAFSFFILVDSLSSSGWIDLWAHWLSKVVQNHEVTAIFFTGFVCIMLCNVSYCTHPGRLCFADHPTRVLEAFRHDMKSYN